MWLNQNRFRNPCVWGTGRLLGEGDLSGGFVKLAQLQDSK